MEEYVGGVWSVGQVPHLVDHQHMRVGVGCEGLLSVSPLTGVGKIFDEFGCRREERLEAVLDGAIPDSYRQMGLPAACFPVQDQRPSLGDEVRPEIGTEEGLPKTRLQGEVELVDGLEEREVRAPGAALQSRLLPSCHFFGQQESEEVPIRPALLFGSTSDLLIDPAHVRQVEASEVNLQLTLGEFQAPGIVEVILCCYRYTSRIFRRHFFPHRIPSCKTREC
jgi:hypothetical protein